MLHHILAPFSKLGGFLLLKSLPGAGWYLHTEQERRWTRGIQHRRLGNYPTACKMLWDQSQNKPHIISFWHLESLSNLKKKEKRKSRWRAMPLYFWPLAKLQRNYCFRGRAGSSSLPLLENKALLLGWMCSWVGINGFYGFLALWHVHFFLLFCILPQLSRPWLANNPFLELLLIGLASSFPLERIFFNCFN